MKYLLITLIFFSSLSLFSQCDFEIIEFNDLRINATSKEMYVLKENQEALTGDYVLFSMYTDGKSKHLLVTYSRVARHQFPDFCLGKDSFLRFTFKDGTSAKLNYRGDDVCKKQTKHPTRANFKALKTEFKFEVDAKSVQKLKQNKVLNFTISGRGGISFTYAVENKIDDSNLETVTYPSSYFKKTLPCLEF